MSDALTLLNQEFKGDVDPGLRDLVTRKLNARFPSYFEDFCAFALSLVLQACAALGMRRLCQKREIASAAAFMAIV